MNKLDSKQQSSTLFSASQPDPEPVRRLIVLVPSLEIDRAAVTRKVWELANAAGSQVLFLGLYGEASQELLIRRELVTMSAMVKDDKVFAEADAIAGKDWVETVKTRCQTGDMVVCFAEHRAGLSNKPLGQILQSKLNVPLYILSGLYPRNESQPNWPSQAAAWTGSIVIILAFLLLQARIDRLAKDWVHMVLMLLTIPAELWLIWGWNSLFE